MHYHRVTSVDGPVGLVAMIHSIGWPPTTKCNNHVTTDHMLSSARKRSSSNAQSNVEWSNGAPNRDAWSSDWPIRRKERVKVESIFDRHAMSCDGKCSYRFRGDYITE